MVFHLPWRQTKGCLQSLVAIHGLPLEIPHQTTFSRRAQGLGKVAFHRPRHDRPLHILVDSTGVKVHSGNMRKPPKNRAWRKLHRVVDANTGDVAACDLGSSQARDAARVPALLKPVERPLAWVAADSAYDTEGVYAAIERHREGRSPRVLIPPTKNAQLRPESTSDRERASESARGTPGPATASEVWPTPRCVGTRPSSVRWSGPARCKVRGWKPEWAARS